MVRAHSPWWSKLRVWRMERCTHARQWSKPLIGERIRPSWACQMYLEKTNHTKVNYFIFWAFGSKSCVLSCAVWNRPTTCGRFKPWGGWAHMQILSTCTNWFCEFFQRLLIGHKFNLLQWHLQSPKLQNCFNLELKLLKALWKHLINPSSRAKLPNLVRLQLHEQLKHSFSNLLHQIHHPPSPKKSF